MICIFELYSDEAIPLIHKVQFFDGFQPVDFIRPRSCPILAPLTYRSIAAE